MRLTLAAIAATLLLGTSAAMADPHPNHHHAHRAYHHHYRHGWHHHHHWAPSHRHHHWHGHHHHHHWR